MIKQFAFESLPYSFDEFDENRATKLRTTRIEKLKLGIWPDVKYVRLPGKTSHMGKI
jgi:hypothetical protein